MFAYLVVLKAFSRLHDSSAFFQIGAFYVSPYIALGFFSNGVG